MEHTNAASSLGDNVLFPAGDALFHHMIEVGDVDWLGDVIACPRIHQSLQLPRGGVGGYDHGGDAAGGFASLQLSQHFRA